MYEPPEYVEPKPRSKKYFMTPLADATASWARFNTSYGEASVTSTCLMSDLGVKQRTTKKKVRSQFNVHSRSEIKKLENHTVTGEF